MDGCSITLETNAKNIERINPGNEMDIRLSSKRILKNKEIRQIHWITTKPEWDFGITIGYLQGIPISVTDIERTLLDALRFPRQVRWGFRSVSSMAPSRG